MLWLGHLAAQLVGGGDPDRQNAGDRLSPLGFQLEIGRDNYAQTNVASGSFAFCGSGLACFSGFGFADFLLGFADEPVYAPIR